MRLIFLNSDVARAKDILESNGIRVLLQEASSGEFELTVRSEHFERALELLAAAGIEVTHTR